MKVSCIPWAMIVGWPDGTPEMTLEELIDVAVDEYQLDGVEMLNLYFHGSSSEYERKIRDRLLWKGLAVSQYTSDSAFALVEREAREQMVERVKRDIDKALFFNSNIIRITGGDPKPGISREESLKKVTEGLADVLPYAEEKGVVLAFENHVIDKSCVEIGGTLREFVEIFEKLKSPFLRANFDTSNAFKAGEDPLAFLETIYSHVVHLHISDIKKNGAHCIVGKGDVDLGSVFSFLNARGYTGWVSVEYSSRGRKGLDESVEYVQQRMLEGPTR